MTGNDGRDFVRELSDALIDADPDAPSLLANATRDDIAAALGIFAAHSVATRGDMLRQLRAIEVLVDGGMRVGMNWQQVWDVQPSPAKQKLLDLYDALPSPLTPIVDAWRAGT